MASDDAKEGSRRAKKHSRRLQIVLDRSYPESRKSRSEGQLGFARVSGEQSKRFTLLKLIYKIF